MKVILYTLGIFSLATAGLHAQLPRVGGPLEAASRIVETGLHHRVWSRTVRERTPSGRVREVEERFVELATGISYVSGNQLVEAREIIEAIPGGAVAKEGQHQVIFARNLATAGAIDLSMPDGQRLRSHVLGLAYFDEASGKSVMIAEVKECIGSIDGNQVLYEDAFTACKADVRYTYTRAGLEQDIILRERPPLPAEFGMNPRTTRLQVYTEFLSPPPPVIRLERMERADGTETVDEALDFGTMRLNRGKAFRLHRRGPGEDVPVRKAYRKLEGRDFLIEEVPLPAVASELEELPAPEGAAIPSGTNTVKRTAAMRLRLPAAPQAARLANATPMLVTKRTPPTQGFVMDYQLLGGDTNNITLQGDTTYFVSGIYTVNGLLTIEGGTVVKYTNNAAFYANAYILANGGVACQTAPYRMAVFTSQDDDTVGSVLPWSTGNPTLRRSLDLFTVGHQTLRGLRFLHAYCAVLSGSGVTVEDCQFVKCEGGINMYWSPSTVRNTLFSEVNIPFHVSAPNVQILGEHITADQFQTLVNVNTSLGSLNKLALTNSLLTRGTSWAITNWAGNLVGAPVTNNAVVWEQDATGIYQTAGGGSYYLAADSPYRNAGVTEVSPNALALIKAGTTYPPVVLSNTPSTYDHTPLASAALNGDTTFSPQAQRDTDAPDLGYHYAPLDYLMNNVQASNVTVRVTGGAVLSYGRDTGLWLFEGASLHCEGTPTRLNGLVHQACVQEQPVAWPVSGFGAYPVVPYRTSTASIEANFRFTQFTALAPGSSHLAQCDDYSHSLLSARDCQFWGGNIGVWSQLANQSARLTFANNMFARVGLTLYSAANITFDGEFRNNTVVGGNFSEDTSSCAQWLVRDNLFYHWDWMDIMGDHAFNAYVGTNQLWPWPELTTNDVVLTNFTFASGPLGDYYHGSTNLVDQGSLTNAALAGLYHHTTRTNQTKDANTRLDIGFHYAACDTNGLPVDTDGDGLPDYLEDANGNGNSADDYTSWLIYNSMNGLSAGNGLKVFTPVKP